MWKSTRLKISLSYNNTSKAIKQGEKELFLRFFRGFSMSLPYIILYAHARWKAVRKSDKLFHDEEEFMKPARFLISRGRYQR